MNWTALGQPATPAPTSIDDETKAFFALDTLLRRQISAIIEDDFEEDDDTEQVTARIRLKSLMESFVPIETLVPQRPSLNHLDKCLILTFRGQTSSDEPSEIIKAADDFDVWYAQAVTAKKIQLRHLGPGPLPENVQPNIFVLNDRRCPIQWKQLALVTMPGFEAIKTQIRARVPRGTQLWSVPAFEGNPHERTSIGGSSDDEIDHDGGFPRDMSPVPEPRGPDFRERPTRRKRQRSPTPSRSGTRSPILPPSESEPEQERARPSTRSPTLALTERQAEETTRMRTAAGFFEPSCIAPFRTEAGSIRLDAMAAKFMLYITRNHPAIHGHWKPPMVKAWLCGEWALGQPFGLNHFAANGIDFRYVGEFATAAATARGGQCADRPLPQRHHNRRGRAPQGHRNDGNRVWPIERRVGIRNTLMETGMGQPHPGPTSEVEHEVS